MSCNKNKVSCSDTKHFYLRVSFPDNCPLTVMQRHDSYRCYHYYLQITYTNIHGRQRLNPKDFGEIAAFHWVNFYICPTKPKQMTEWAWNVLQIFTAGGWWIIQILVPSSATVKLEIWIVYNTPPFGLWWTNDSFTSANLRAKSHLFKYHVSNAKGQVAATSKQTHAPL